MSRSVDNGRAVIQEILMRLWFPGLLIGLWWLTAEWADNVFLPGPREVITALIAWANDGLARDLGASLGSVSLGYLLAIAVGIPAGIVIGLIRPVRWFVSPLISIFRGLPPPALISVFILVLGFSTSMRVSIIAWTVVWPVLLHTVDGIRRVDRAYLDTAAAFDFRPWRRLQVVILPAASPYILAGMKTGLGLAMIMIVVSEMVSADRGLGHFILASSNSFNFAAGWAGALVMGIVGYLANSGFAKLERRLLFWQERTPRRRSFSIRSNRKGALTS